MSALEKGDTESYTAKTRRDTESYTVKTRRDAEEKEAERQSLDYPAPTQTRVRRTLGLLKGLKGKGEQQEIWAGEQPEIWAGKYFLSRHVSWLNQDDRIVVRFWPKNLNTDCY